MKFLCSIVLAMLASISVNAAEPAAFSLPELELAGQLSSTLEFSDCEFISGLSCAIKLKNNAILPSKIFVQELNQIGSIPSKKYRLIYPNIKPNEIGHATFKLINSNPKKLILTGVWSGEYANPY